MKTMIKSIAAAALLMPCIAAADTLQQYVIERELPNAGQLTDQELHNISARSAEVLEELGPGISGSTATWLTTRSTVSIPHMTST